MRKKDLIKYLRCYGSLGCSENTKCPLERECFREFFRRLDEKRTKTMLKYYEPL